MLARDLPPNISGDQINGDWLYCLLDCQSSFEDLYDFKEARLCRLYINKETNFDNWIRTVKEFGMEERLFYAKDLPKDINADKLKAWRELIIDCVVQLQKLGKD